MRFPFTDEAVSLCEASAKTFLGPLLRKTVTRFTIWYMLTAQLMLDVKIFKIIWVTGVILSSYMTSQNLFVADR